MDARDSWGILGLSQWGKRADVSSFEILVRFKIPPDESYSGICVLADLFVCVKYTNTRSHSVLVVQERRLWCKF